MFSNPKSNLEQMGLSPGMKVADLGVGAGYYAREAAKMVGPEGRVFGIDVQKELALHLKIVSKDEGLDNLESIWGDIEKPGGTKLKDSAVDVCLATNVFFLVDNKENLALEIWRILKPGGKALVVDWLDSFGGLGPERDLVFPEEKAESLFLDHRFKIEKEIDAGDHHYGFVVEVIK